MSNLMTTFRLSLGNKDIIIDESALNKATMIWGNQGREQGVLAG